MAYLTPFFKESERKSCGCQHRLFFSQVEYCDSLIFHRRAALDQLLKKHVGFIAALPHLESDFRSSRNFSSSRLVAGYNETGIVTKPKLMAPFQSGLIAFFSPQPICSLMGSSRRQEGTHRREPLSRRVPALPEALCPDFAFRVRTAFFADADF